MRDRKMEDLINQALKKSGKMKEIAQDGFAGRPWGNGKNNPFSGSHAVFGVGDEVVTVFARDGVVVIKEYKASADTNLGKEIRQMLLEHNLPIAQ